MGFSSCLLQDEECNGPPANMSWTVPLPYPSYHQVEATGTATYPIAAQDSPSQRLTATSGKSRNSKRANVNGNSSTLTDLEIYPQYDMWGLPVESPHASSLTEDDFLEMVST